MTYLKPNKKLCFKVIGLFFLALLAGGYEKSLAQAVIDSSRPNFLLYRLENMTFIYERCDQGKADCQGEQRYLSTLEFKKSLRDQFNLELFTFPLPDERDRIYLELDRLNSFFVTYGEFTSKPISQELFEKAFESRKNSSKLLKSIKSFISNTADLIMAGPEKALSKIAQDNFSVLPLALRKFDPELIRVCGSEGSVEERIRDCNFSLQGWRLVLRTQDLTEVYYHEKLNSFWANGDKKTFSYIDGAMFCKKFGEESGLVSVEWDLPSVGELKKLESTTLMRVIKNKDHFFWSSTDVIGKVDKKKLLNGHDMSEVESPLVDESFNYNHHSVLCSGR